MTDMRAVDSFAVAHDLTRVPAEAWDSLQDGLNPFLTHRFLVSLQESGCVGEEAGWLPQHLLAYDATGRLIGAVPAYIKGHSFGEFVFDWGWADAFERAGGAYYPKLQCAVPFTPVTGPRLLVREDQDRDAVRADMIDALEAIAAQQELSSIHVTFPREEEWQFLGEQDWLQRRSTQYHWVNQGYESFDDFLSALSSRKRKQIRKERREVAESGVEVLALTGDDLREEHWDAFYANYRATGMRKFGAPYLNRDFFALMHERMRDEVLLVLARDDGEWIAGAINFIGPDTLFGRNWGSQMPSKFAYRFLHFEACYYQAIDFAIQRGLTRVEAGAQGEHKIQRGYLPTPTYSAHWIRHPQFRQAVADFLRRETRAVERDMEVLTEHSPFKRAQG